MEKQDVQVIAQLLPIAVDLTTRIVSFAKEAKAGGVEIPEIDELKKLNAELKALEDL